MSAIIYPMDKIRAGRLLAIKAAQTEEIGLRIVTARKAASLTQADLRRFTGLASAQISQWETGKHRPSLDALVVLLPFLEVDLDYLFLGDDTALAWPKRMQLQNAYEEAINEAMDRKAAQADKASKSG
jgi:transcriptional regulator with XRE-family HTH domain